MLETKQKLVNSKDKVFQSLIPLTFRKKWCMSCKTDAMLVKQVQCFWLAFIGAVLPAAQQVEPAPGAVQCTFHPPGPKSSRQCRWKAALQCIHRATPLPKALVIHDTSFRAGMYHRGCRDMLQFGEACLKVSFWKCPAQTKNQVLITCQLCFFHFTASSWVQTLIPPQRLRRGN